MMSCGCRLAMLCIPPPPAAAGQPLRQRLGVETRCSPRSIRGDFFADEGGQRQKERCWFLFPFSVP